MTSTLEQNNLDAQISLMNDIIKNNNEIVYHFMEKAKELRLILNESRFDPKEPNATRTLSLSNQQVEKITDIISIMETESKHNRLGILAETAVPDNKIKKEILSILQKTIIKQ